MKLEHIPLNGARGDLIVLHVHHATTEQQLEELGSSWEKKYHGTVHLLILREPEPKATWLDRFVAWWKRGGT
jgi:hypothetical protein